MDTDITEALETLASGQPTAPALHVPGRRTLSYADLGAQIRYVRRQVGGWGVVRGDLIAGVIPPRPEMALACATFPAVATFAPLSPALTSDSYAELLTRLRPKVVILPDEIDHPIRTAARRCGVAEVDLRTDASAPAGMFTVELARQQESLSRAAPSRRDWAYVIATSGTTGRPKLVPRSHRQLALHAQSLGELCRLGADDVGCHLLRMHHTHGIDAALMIPLLRGSSVVCLPEFDIEGFFTALDEYRVSWLTAVFTVYREILRRAPDFREAVARNNLRFMRVTSGLLEPDEADRIEHTFGTPLLAGYGMTEVRMIAHEPLAPRARKRRSAGVPVCSEVAVVSKAGAICSTGEVGEVVVRGPAVFDGYFDDEKATAAAFVDGWFRTGDLGRFDEDGYLYLVGRIKDLINRGGEKIAPAEIDAAIAPIPGIREVATFAIPHQSLGEEIAAAVVVDGTVAIHASDIIEQVRQRLGPKRVPRHIYFVDRLPRTDSGKVRRSELPQLVERERLDARSAGGSHIEEPGVVASAMEAALAGIWASVLKAKKVGRADDFFMLGGDSLSGARLLANIKSLFGVDLPLASLFDRAATVAGMARMIEEARARGAARDHAADSLRSGGTIPRRQPDGAAILSDTQQRMWFLAKLDPDTSSYNESRAYRLLGSIDAEALRRALRFVAGRHEILRATYSLIDDEPRQIVHADATLDLQLADLSDTPAVQQDEALQRLLLGETQRPFDLAKGPTLRLVLVRLSDREHVLLRVAHHISVDGWSAGILEQELSSAYNAFVSKREPAWAELPIQYADYAAWQREWLQSEVLEQQLGYWKAQLADLPTLTLPTDRPRPAVVSDRGARALFDLPAPLLQGLKEVGRREGATLFMTLLAAFQVLLYRYSGQEDIAVGVPIAGRRRSELQGLIGFFANTLVLRGDLAGNPLFRELLARVRERALGAYTHQDVPFEKLVEELAPARDLSRNPLFQVMFALQNAPGATLALQGVQASPLALAGHTAKFDLSLAVRESDEGLHARWEYSTDLFDAATIERMARHFERLLEGIVADPQQRIGALPLLSAAERYQLLVEWNDTAADRRDGCVHELFEDQAARSPDAVAVVFEERQLTYAELNARANRVAHHLIDLGVKPEVLVGLCMERSLEMIVGLLGILKAGGAYVPLDPAYPVDRLTFMLADTQAPVLLTQQRLLSRLAQHPGQILCIDSDPPAASAARSENPPRQARPENLAYVIYTSGSTGRPKGVAIEHRSAVAFLHWVPTVFSDSELAATLFSTSICFDLSIFELFAPLSRGGAVILAQNALQLPELPAAGRVTLINTVPSAMTELMRLGAVPASVRTVNLAGEPLPGSLARSIYELRHVDQLYNLFGPTEDTTYSTYALMGRGDTEAPSIGRPIAGTRLYVLDRNGSPVPVGVPGELYIGGAGLARGYLNRPELTAERFVPDPFTTEPGARLYRTGDLVRYRPDGNLDYLGRLDEQVKVRGFRIELGEIEAVLSRHPSIRQAVVSVREDTTGGKQLVAYVVPTDASFPGVQPLRALLQVHLPDYMLPSAYVVLERLPLTPNGKVDRRALPAPQYERGELGVAFVAARDSLEELVSGVWRDVLKLDRVGVHDSFFELGGHSLLAVQVVARLGKLLNIELPLRRFFEMPTVSAIAAEAEKMLRSGESRQVAPLVPLERTRDSPPSFAQQRLWFLDRLLPARETYNIATAWRLRGELDIAALERSLDLLISRHEALRTRFAMSEGGPVQVIDPPHSVPLPVADLSAMPRAGCEARAREIAEAEAREPFDLESGPLLRAQLLRLAPEEHLLVVNVHHIVSDGWSMGILEHELSSAYNAFAAGREPRLPELPIQYADYAAWQRGWLQGAALEQQLAYWKGQLANLPTLTLATDRPRPAFKTYEGGHAVVDLPGPLMHRAKELSRREGATLFMTLLAAFQLLLCRYSGQEDIAVGAPIAGRRSSEVEGLIGFFANTLVLRVDLSGNPPFRELLARVRESALGAYTHQDVPFEKLVEELAPARDLSRNPLFQVMFVLQDPSGAAFALDRVEVSRLSLERHTAKFDLSLSMRESAAGLRAIWEYSTDLFEASTIERMTRHFERLLEGIVANPQQRIGELPLLGAAERRQLLVEWNDTAADCPGDRCVHALFEDQVVRTPEAIAVVFEDRQLTYAELNARANRVAHHLIDLGVGSEARVGLAMERSLESIVGLLGILKAGGAYVPLDPSYPKSRLAFVLKETAAPVLLTQERLLQRLPHYEGCTLCLDRDWPLIARRKDANPGVPVSAASLGYVIYTSGSTGEPKGIAMPHATLANLLAWHRDRQEAPGGRIAQFTSISFDVSLQEIFYALVSGKTLVVVPADTQLDPDKLSAFIEGAAITDLFAPNVVLEHLARATLQAKRQLPTLAHVYQAGEALTITPALKAFFEEHPACRLHNHYGPAESHVVTAATLSADTGSWPYRPVIGKPIRNVRLYILDSHGEPVPPNAPGELYIGGSVLARGYLNRPELTAESFVRDPFSEVPGARMYRTGDRVRYRADGNIEFLGRIDDQVKVRGFRIEPAEIAAALAEHPAVRQAVVFAREDVAEDKQLVAYIVPVDASFADTAQLHVFMRERLPQYMLPSAYVVLERLPLSLNGKVNRQALPAPQYDRSAIGIAFAAPRSSLEELLTGVWCEVLKAERVGVHDNFFDLGGHSLLVTQMISRVREACGIDLPLRWVFEAPTVAGLAERIETDGKKGSQDAATCAVAVQPHGDRAPLFFVSGFGGAILPFQALARELGPQQPLYVLDVNSLSDLPAARVKLESIGAQMLDSMRKVQPRGPYHVAGYSLGGKIVYEIAQQLHRDREAVGLLALLDCNGPGYPRKQSFPSRTVSHIKHAWTLAPGASLAYVAERIVRLQKYLKRAAPKVYPQVFREDDAARRTEAARAIQARAELIYDAWRAYVPRFYPGRLTLIRAEVRNPAPGVIDNDPLMGWAKLVGDGIDVAHLPCAHSEMLEARHARALARLLNERLTRRERNAPAERRRAAPATALG